MNKSWNISTGKIIHVHWHDRPKTSSPEIQITAYCVKTICFGTALGLQVNHYWNNKCAFSQCKSTFDTLVIYVSMYMSTCIYGEFNVIKTKWVYPPPPGIGNWGLSEILEYLILLVLKKKASHQFQDPCTMQRKFLKYWFKRKQHKVKKTTWLVIRTYN